MFNAVHNLSTPLILCGLIWAVVLGFSFGNYACSLVHRLPRGRLLLDKTPYCGNCGTLLQVKDLFPVVSALLLRHRCRYCGQKFPVSHTWTELLVGLLFALTFLQVNFSEQFILIVSLGVFLITLAAIHANEGIIMRKILFCAIMSGILYRTYMDHTLYGFIEGGFLALVIGLIIKRKDIKKVGHIYTLPPLAELLAAGGLCVGSHALPIFMVLFLGFYILSRLISRRIPVTVPFGFAIMLPVMYPQLSLLLFHSY